MNTQKIQNTTIDFHDKIMKNNIICYEIKLRHKNHGHTWYLVFMES